jgi:hypothetical protein
LDALYKSVILFNRFKKCIQEEDPKNLLCKGAILKDFFAVGKAKLAYFARGKDLFTIKKFQKF